MRCLVSWSDAIHNGNMAWSLAVFKGQRFEQRIWYWSCRCYCTPTNCNDSCHNRSTCRNALHCCSYASLSCGQTKTSAQAKRFIEATAMQEVRFPVQQYSWRARSDINCFAAQRQWHRRPWLYVTVMPPASSFQRPSNESTRVCLVSFKYVTLIITCLTITLIPNFFSFKQPRVCDWQKSMQHVNRWQCINHSKPYSLIKYECNHHAHICRIIEKNRCETKNYNCVSWSSYIYIFMQQDSRLLVGICINKFCVWSLFRIYRRVSMNTFLYHWSFKNMFAYFENKFA